MLRGLFTICISILFFSFLSAQEVPEVQKTLLTKITATWCPNCGSWGWTFFEQLIEDNSEKAVFVGAHHSGDLVSPPGEAFSTNFMAPYQPYFYAGNFEVGATSGNIATKRQEVKNIVDANYLQSPIANVGFEAQISGNAITVNTKTIFFQETSGEYYLALYILEDGVINNQAANSSMAIHPFVIRSSFTTAIFGNLLASGTISDGTEFLDNFELNIDSEWNADSLYVAGIIWDKSGDTYEFVNVNMTREFDSTVAVNAIPSTNMTIDLYPTITSTNSQLLFDLKDQPHNVAIQLFNIEGKVIQQIFNGTLNLGKSSLNIPTNKLSSGLYFVNIQTQNGETITKRLIVK